MTGWVVSSRVSYCSGAAGARAAGDNASYITRESECCLLWSNLTAAGLQVAGGFDADRSAAVTGWRAVVAREVEKRVSARHSQKIMMPLPNGLTPEQQREFIARWVVSAGMDKHPCIIAVHRGESGDTEKNLHLHAVICPRAWSGVVDRDMSRRAWLYKTRDTAAGELTAFGIKIETPGDRLRSRGHARPRRLSRAAYELARARARGANQRQGRALAREERQRPPMTRQQRECRLRVAQLWPSLRDRAAVWMPSPVWSAVRELEASGSMVDAAIAAGLRDSAAYDQQQRRWLKGMVSMVATAARGDFVSALDTARRLNVAGDDYDRQRAQVRGRSR